MKILPIIGLIVLIGACADPENHVKDMRGDEAQTVEDYNDSSTPETSDDGQADQQPPDEVKTDENTSEWSYKVLLVSENNWGYQLFQEGKMIINQTSIPSVQGINGFDSPEKAERTAEFILNKLKNGIFPPTVNKEDLDSLGVLRD